MGSTTSKSPLERRNTVARRSQRRTLHNLKPKIDNVYKDIKRFKGATEDTNFQALMNEIDYLRTDLGRRAKDLQPQVRNLYENIYKRICEAENELKQKLLENQEKLEKKEAKQKGKITDNDDDDDEFTSKTNGSVLSEEQDPDRIEIMSDVSTAVPSYRSDSFFQKQNEVTNLENNKEKRKSVQLKVVKVVSEEETPTSPQSPKEAGFRTPEERRKSILKTGIAVMPGAILKEMFGLKKNLKHSESNSSNKVQFEDNSKVVQNVYWSNNDKSPHLVVQKNKVEMGVHNTTNNAVSSKVQFDAKPKEILPKDILKRINEIVDILQNTEMEISEFVGQKNGKLYTKMKNQLTDILLELNNIKSLDEDVIDQQKSAITYVNSCFSFLDERSTDKVLQKANAKSVGDDDVFFNSNVPIAKRQASVEDILKLQSLMKNTPV